MGQASQRHGVIETIPLIGAYTRACWASVWLPTTAVQFLLNYPHDYAWRRLWKVSVRLQRRYFMQLLLVVDIQPSKYLLRPLKILFRGGELDRTALIKGSRPMTTLVFGEVCSI